MNEPSFVPSYSPQEFSRLLDDAKERARLARAAAFDAAWAALAAFARRLWRQARQSRRGAGSRLAAGH
jgi:hypothetical protein